MSQFLVKRYQPSYKQLWDEFVSKAKNATFLFYRDFMEYHQDRFDDFSLLIFNEDKLVALLPANRVEDKVYSHQGLTYGGLVFSEAQYANTTFNVLDEIKSFLLDKRIRLFYFKSIPSIYVHDYSKAKDFYFLNNGGEILKRNKVLAVNYNKPLQIHKTKLKYYRRKDKLSLEIKQDNNFDAFWDKVLIPRLQSKYNVKPVHTLEEIKILNFNFPENILQYNIYNNDEVLAGITIFNTGTVVKSQYGATTANGEKFKALDVLFVYLINKFKSEGKQFFSMGTVTDNSFQEGFNPGLLRQKEELGCTVYYQDYYELKLND